ncbi:hypothetical protein H4W31_006370 [Plantactinospora soyae]|uniref:Uncharacterized protein n=1 Tax=Plantactinospora soyae TaxID=1544732 RepID=A0A927MA01_9ACTN|nr:hypothetical protein [Plantactinospora soyae]
MNGSATSHRPSHPPKALGDALAIDAGAYDYPPDATGQERQFDYSFGLTRILDGVETLVRYRAETTR